MTEKEVRKLKRKDLLQLLLEEAENVAKLKMELEEYKKSAAEYTEHLNQLKERLDKKDDKIKKLEKKMDDKDTVIIGLNNELCIMEGKFSQLQRGLMALRQKQG